VFLKNGWGAGSNCPKGNIRAKDIRGPNEKAVCMVDGNNLHL